MGTDKPVEPHEGPVHDVTVKSFYLAKTEVTFDDIDKWLADTKRDTGTVPSLNWGRGKMAAHMTSWLTAVEYCNWLSEKEKLSKCYVIKGEQVTYLDTAKGYRLPTEAEWEFAARGGNKSKGTLYAGSENLEEVGWVKSNSNEGPHKVAQKKPNELGLYDMTGNLWEWVWDWYDTFYYQKADKTDPKGPETGMYHVMRGGAWYNYPNYANVYTRQNAAPAFRQNSVGFRVARTYY
jgi:formylglycine-generating enzyme required for sulfatase activity